MPSSPPSIEEIELNEALKRLGVTKFYKEESILTIMFGEDRMLQFDIDEKKVEKTKDNIREVAKKANFDVDIINDLIFKLGVDYARYLKLPEVKKETESKNTDGKQKEQSSAVKAVHLARQYCQELFLDNLGQPYAAIKVNEHTEVSPIKSDTLHERHLKLHLKQVYFA